MRYKPKMLTDIARRIAVANAEPTRMALRWLLKNKTIPAQARMLAMLQLAEMPALTGEFTLRAQCVVTGRRRAVVAEYGVSRHVFREDALKGYIDGVRKAMW
jgi:small subunit ribosomal protein S14